MVSYIDKYRRATRRSESYYAINLCAGVLHLGPSLDNSSTSLLVSDDTDMHLNEIESLMKSCKIVQLGFKEDANHYQLYYSIILITGSIYEFI